MAWRFVRQPNGKLARFSDVVDHFTHYNYSRDEAVELARESMGREDAEQKVESGLRDEVPWKHGVYGDGSARWLDCLQTIESVHGKEERAKVEAEFGGHTEKSL